MSLPSKPGVYPAICKYTRKMENEEEVDIEIESSAKVIVSGVETVVPIKFPRKSKRIVVTEESVTEHFIFFVKSSLTAHFVHLGPARIGSSVVKLTDELLADLEAKNIKFGEAVSFEVKK